MYKNNESKVIQPSIFTKKLSNNYKIISYKNVINTLGSIRYFPPANQEWFNSIYSYNNNYIKKITIADKNLSKLIKNYFNLYFSNKLIYRKHISIRLRRLSMNKIFISKAELKHTSSKVVITLYTYNEERRILSCKIKRIENMLFSKEFKNKRTFSLREKLNIIRDENKNISLQILLKKLITFIYEEIKMENNILVTKNYESKINKQLKVKILENNLRDLLSIFTICEINSVSHKYYEKIFNKIVNKTFLEKEIMTIAYYKLILGLNKFKFEDKLLSNLKPMISKIYNKEVEFNIVNLRAIYLNSDLFTQAISLSLKKKNNILLKVLRSFLYMVKIPKRNVIRERFNYNNSEKIWVNAVKNLRVNYLFQNNKDSLNQLLLSLLKDPKLLNKIEENKFLHNRTTGLLSYISNILKYKNIGGVRLEVKGRLTKRFTASRSIFKIKWKGSLKNIDSSYGGLSSVMLRGNIKSNIQYSAINSKTRNGTFGIKGWISSK